MIQLEPHSKFELKEAVRQRFHRYVANLLSEHSLTELVLVVDQSSLKLLSNLFKITELVGMGITLLERLDLRRKVMEGMQALYFIEPREETIKQVIDDFKERRQYKKLHLLFTSAISKSNLKLLSLESNIIKYLAKHSIKQFFHGIYFVEGNTFTLRLEYLKVAYSEYDTDKEQRLRNKVASRLVDLFYNVGEFFQVNIYYNKSANCVSRKVAELVKDKIQECVGIMHKNQSRAVNSQAQDVELIIMDRSLDPITPLLHDLRYESMLFDLLGLQLEYYPHEEQKKQESEVTTKTKKTQKTDKQEPSEKGEDNKKKKKAKTTELKTQEASLKEEGGSMQELKELPMRKKQLPKKEPMPKGLNEVYGALYEQYRHQYLPVLMEKVPADIESHKQRINNVTSETATEIDTGLTKQLSLHHMLIRECFGIYKQQQLETVIGLEQCLATGIDESGKQTSSVELLQRVRQLINQTSLQQQDKLRLGLLAMCCISLSEADFKAIRSQYPSQEDRKALDNLLWLGVTVSSSVQRSTKNINEKSRAYALEKMQRTNMPLSRYTSVVGNIIPIIVEAMLKGVAIDQSFFSMIIANLNEKKLAARQEPKQQQRRKKRMKAQPPKTRKKLILFFIGGVSFSQISELRSIQSLGYFDLIIGTDQLLTPQSYLTSLLKMKQRD